MKTGEAYFAWGDDGWATYRLDSVGPVSLTRCEGTAELVLAPGFVDHHIHGAFGIDFMSATAHEVAELADRLSDVGYEGFFPTTVTAPLAQVQNAVARLPKHTAVWGWHLEGPFISPKHPGAQPLESILDLADCDPAWYELLDDPRLRKITLAPERPGATEVVKRLAGRGVLVSMGHTDATFAECRAAYDAGAHHTTHTYNAMRPLHHREAGTVGFALSEPNLFAELIYDRFHVAKEAAKILASSRDKNHLVAVSDSTMAAGMPDGPLTMWGHACEVKGGAVRLAGTGTLAGSASTLADVFKCLYADLGAPTAVAACCIAPRVALGLTKRPQTWIVADSSGTVIEIHREDSE